MRTTFSGFELASRALAAQQRALDVTGHNIANASTAGYVRQRVVLTATDPYTFGSFGRPAQAGMVGTGVEVAEIQRLSSSFLNAQARMVTSDTEAWNYRHEALSRLEALTNEPGDSGLHVLLDRFWSSWQALSTDPGSTALRQGVVQAASSLADGFARTDRQLRELVANADQGIRSEVAHINSLADQITSLNQTIRAARGLGDNPNDLLDQRDLLLEELAGVTNIQVREYSDGSVAVSISGYDLVQQFGVNRLQVLNEDFTGYAKVVWEESGVPVGSTAGSLVGLTEMRDEIYLGFKADLDSLADAITGAVNAAHAAGYDLQTPPQLGGEFFDTSVGGAAGMRVSAAIAADVLLIAAGSTPEAGDGNNATAIAGLEGQGLAALSGGTVGDFYRGVISAMAIGAQEAERAVLTHELLARQIENQKSQSSGVSLDEEMVEMMKFQHAYTAAARVLTVMDEMIVTLIERMGAGR